MLDRVYAGEHGVAGGLVAVAVAGNFLPQPVGLVAQGGHLFQGELGRIDFVGQRQDAAGRAELDDVGAVLDLVPDGLAETDRGRRRSRRPRGAAGAGRGAVRCGPSVPAEGPQRVHADEHPRAGDRPPWRSSSAARRRASRTTRHLAPW